MKNQGGRGIESMCWVPWSQRLPGEGCFCPDLNEGRVKAVSRGNGAPGGESRCRCLRQEQDCASAKVVWAE